jgi:hypothetical protein
LVDNAVEDITANKNTERQHGQNVCGKVAEDSRQL